MDNVLIWDENQEESEELCGRLEKLNQFKVESAKTAGEVHDILENRPVSVVVINFENDHLEKLEVIGYMTRHKWATPCIVMIECGYTDILKQIKQEILHIIPKPIEFKDLVSSIIKALYLRDEGKSHSGMSLINLLLMLELSKQTCRLEIRAQGGLKGYFYFQDGELLDAEHQKLYGDDAVSELLEWEKIMVFFRGLPERRTRKRFTQNLMEIIEPRLTKNNIAPF